MHINYEVTQDDLIEFYLFHMQYDRRAIRARFFQALLGCFVIAVITFGVIAYFKLDAIKGWIVGILIMIAFFGLYQVFFRIMMRQRIIALLKKNHPYDSYGAKSMTFEKDHLMETTGGLKRKLFYKDILRSIETKDYFYIYEQPGIAYTIPKRCLSNKASDEIRSYLNMTATEGGKDPLKESLADSLLNRPQEEKK